MTHEGGEAESYRILFVCTGNTCRSPMAAALARHAVRERGWRHVEVASAGTSALAGAPPSDYVPIVLEEAGVDPGEHQAAELTPELIDRADTVLVMGPAHLYVVEAMGGGDKAALITAFLDGDEAGAPVADPIGGDIEMYRETRDQLVRAVDAVLDRLQVILAP